MTKKQIVTDKAFTPVYAYSQGIVANGFLYTSGFGPHDPKTGEIIGDSIEEQTVATLANVSAVLAAEGLDLSDVVKATVHLAELKSEGITDHVSPSHAIDAGHMVCQKLSDGMTPNEVAYDVLNSSSMPGYHCGYFVGAAIDAYCPQYRPEETAPSGA